ncbi:hypothetical protein [Frondihabitans australicus]|uniref:Uncharacterized protein n=1 Tax=Frondihabitans australicus TaxID=386892 RepID=A0A495IFL7_9MICO|nr:hypothetical protein [Frondihabitans australicus]RKR74803.1 hypothetical protein C8E83_1933 [Frondihabitans australicus]
MSIERRFQKASTIADTLYRVGFDLTVFDIGPGRVASVGGTDVNRSTNPHELLDARPLCAVRKADEDLETDRYHRALHDKSSEVVGELHHIARPYWLGTRPGELFRLLK